MRGRKVLVDLYLKSKNLLFLKEEERGEAFTRKKKPSSVAKE